jgi:N utilization substance protein A
MPASFIVNALQPAEVAKVVLDEDAERIEVVVPDEQLSLAIGRRGQNVRLASQLTGWDIDIMTEEEESSAARRNSPSAPAVHGSARCRRDGRPAAGVRRLRHNRGSCLCRSEEIAAIEGFDDETADELQARAREYLDKGAELDAKRKELGVEDDASLRSTG